MRLDLSTVAACALVCSAVPLATAQDLFKETAARREVAIEKAKVKVNEAIQASRRASDTRAREILNQARVDLRGDTELPDATITTLDKRILAELDTIDKGAENKKLATLPPPRTGPATTPPPAAKQDRMEIDEEGLWNAKRRKFDNIQKAEDKKGDNFSGQLNKVEEAAVPPKGDFVPPSAEKQKLFANRTTMDGHPTVAEKAVIAKLGQPLGKAMDGVRVTDFFTFLKDRHGIEVIYSQKDLEANTGGGDVLSATTPKISGNLSIRSALRMVTGKFNLSYWIVDEGVEVVSQEKARSTLITRSYYIGDLVAVYQPPTWNYQLWRNAWGNPVLVYGPNPAGTPLGQQLQMRQNVQSLIQMIVDIDPSAFKGENPSTVVYHPGTMSIIIKATAENHQKIMGGGR